MSAILIFQENDVSIQGVNRHGLAWRQDAVVVDPIPAPHNLVRSHSIVIGKQHPFSVKLKIKSLKGSSKGSPCLIRIVTKSIRGSSASHCTRCGWSSNSARSRFHH